MYCDTYACLEPKFQWKRELPIGEIQLVPSEEPKEGPLTNITEKTLDTESNNRNIIKEETVNDNEGAPPETIRNVTDELGLVSIPPLPSTDTKLLDTTQNLLVSLPIDKIDDQELTDATAATQPISELNVAEPSTSNTEKVSEIPITVCCSINLSDIAVKLKDGKMILPKPKVPLYKAKHTHKRLYMVLPKYSKIQVLPGITSCRLMKYNKQAIELNSLLMKSYAKDGLVKL